MILALRKFFPFFVSGLLLTGCQNEKETSVTEIALTNNSEQELSDKAVSIEKSRVPKAENDNEYPLLISASDTISSQLIDLDGDGKWDELFFVADFSAEETKTLVLEWTDDQPDYEVRTSVRFGKREGEDEPVESATEETLSAEDMPKALGFQKYQTDGPTWENDKVAFRHYLDGRNAKDVFGKTSSKITPENVGINDAGAVEDNYHTMEDWGRDIFPVGNSVGLGGFALMVDDEVKRLGVTVEDTLSNIEETNFEIVEEGPVKSVLQYNYNNWEVGDTLYNAEEITTIWPGMYGFKNEVKLNNLQGNETLLIGLSNINNENPVQEVEIADFVALILHDYQTYEREWLLGTALLIPKEDYKGYIEAPEEGQLTDSYLVKVTTENNRPITYYALAAGEMSPDENFEDPEYFKNYVENMAQQLSAEINVQVKTSETK